MGAAGIRPRSVKMNRILIAGSRPCSNRLPFFAANYLLDISVLHLIPLAAVATHFHWVYPLVAAISAAFTLAITRYARPLAFSLAALPLVLSVEFRPFCRRDGVVSRF